MLEKEGHMSIFEGIGLALESVVVHAQQKAADIKADYYDRDYKRRLSKMSEEERQKAEESYDRCMGIIADTCINHKSTAEAVERVMHPEKEE